MTNENDLIRRADAIAFINSGISLDTDADREYATEMLKNIPSAEPTGDLISRADAIDAVARQWLFEASAESPYVNDDDIGDYRKLASELLSDIPSAEAVQGDLVRCNECKHYRAEYGSCTAEHWDLSRVTFPHVEPNDYCSYGENKKIISELFVPARV